MEVVVLVVVVVLLLLHTTIFYYYSLPKKSIAKTMIIDARPEIRSRSSGCACARSVEMLRTACRLYPRTCTSQ